MGSWSAPAEPPPTGPGRAGPGEPSTSRTRPTSPGSLDRAPAGAGLPVGHRLPVLGLRLSRPAGRFRAVVVGVGPGVQVAAMRGGRVAEAVAVLVVVPRLAGVRLSHCRAPGGLRRRGGAGAHGGRR